MHKNELDCDTWSLALLVGRPGIIARGAICYITHGFAFCWNKVIAGISLAAGMANYSLSGSAAMATGPPRLVGTVGPHSVCPLLFLVNIWHPVDPSFTASRAIEFCS